MCFVDFMIIGAAKCGTTTLAEILSSHPNICFSRIKEPHFFSKSQNWRENLEEYKNIFNPQSKQIVGEASTTYTCYPEFNKNIWQALYDFNPNLKLIYIMRHPVDRIISHYMHNYLKGYTSDSLEKAILTDASYINRTRYFIQIKPYLDRFGKDKILLLTLEDFLARNNENMVDIANFLSVELSGFSKNKIHKNKSIGETKNNVKIDAAIGNNRLIKSVKAFLPKTLRKLMYDTIQKMITRKLGVKPTMSQELKEAVWNLIQLDIEEIEDIMDRKLLEWSR